ncbi:MAG: redoxin domain-containing protein [Bacteroides sp.]|nr:redoxin domain-containing protein [Bacteroides sp.]
MKRLYILFLPLIFLFGCKGTPQTVTVQGEIRGLGTDTLLLFGNDELSDTLMAIPVADGKFSLEIPIDTLLQTMLVLPEQHIYPIYLNKGDKISITADINDLSLPQVTGNHLNNELTAFYQNMKEAGDFSQDTLEVQTEKFIRSHQASLASIYLLDKYFIQQDSFKTEKVKDLIASMDGVLRDKPFIQKISTYIEDSDKSLPGKTAPSFSVTDSEGTRISRTNTYRNKILLLHFWASWSDSCLHYQQELKDIYKEYIKPEKERRKRRRESEDDSKFEMLSVSLDVDKASWQDAIKKDTLEWTQVCDLTSWQSNIVKQYSILTLPTNILIGTDGRILARNIQGETLKERIKQLLDAEKEKEERKNRRN